jgi:hypothetical protein
MSDAAGNISKATSTAQRTVMISRWPPNNSEEGKKQVSKNIDSSHFKSRSKRSAGGERDLKYKA